ncbi:hypothetical protein QCA50_015101 [Cerrena zonata]|uniref:Uncharacterized protein n=1 Tax=Cerrena zonata TaxID=2478898 RepID=A0AAW0FRS3_9APHY
MSDHSKEGAHHSPDSTTYNTPADSDESDTPRPVTTVSLPAVHVTTATPRASEVAAGARPILDSQSLPAANTTPTGYASPRSPGFASVAGPSSASYFHQQQPTPSSTSFDSSSRFKRHSLVPSMGTGGTIQESPIEEEPDDSRSKLVPDQPLSQSPSQVSVPVPPPKPPSRNPSSIREPRSTYPNPTRRVSLPEPDLAYSPHGRRQRSYDITYDRPRSANGRRSEPALSPRPSWHVDRRYSDHEPAYYERDNGHRSASRNGNGRDSGYGERPYRDERPYPEVMAEEGRISRRSILEQNSIPTQNELQLLKELSLKEKRDEFRYPLGSVGSRLSPTLKHAKAALLEAQKTSKATGWALNVAIGAQVILGALNHRRRSSNHRPPNIHRHLNPRRPLYTRSILPCEISRIRRTRDEYNEMQFIRTIR